MPRNHLPLSRLDVTAQEYADLAGNYDKSIAYYVNGELTSIGGQPLGGGGVVETARKLLQLAEDAQANNWRINPVVLSYELISLNYHADAAALQTAFPAAANTNKAGYVGTAAAYQIFVSDGTAWTARSDIFAYFRASEPVTTGYTELRPPIEFGLSDNDTFGGNRMVGKLTMLGGIAGSVNPTDINSIHSSFTKSPSGTMGVRPGITRIKTTEPRVIVSCDGSSNRTLLRVNVDGRWRAISDPTLTAQTPLSKIDRLYSFTTHAAGGYPRMLWDFSALSTPAYEFEYDNARAAGLGFGVTRFWIRNNRRYLESTPAPLPGVWLTDSTGGTSPDAGAENCWPHWANAFLGTPDGQVYSDGSTGFVANASGAARKHADKVSYLGTFPQYDRRTWVAFAASVNDGPNLSGIQSEIRSCVSIANAQWNSPLIFIIGPTAAVSTSNQADMLAVDQMLASFVPTLGLSNVLHIPTMSARAGQPITGTTYAENANGSGTSELYFTNIDGTHPLYVGHRFWGRDIVAAGMLQALREYVAKNG